MPNTTGRHRVATDAADERAHRWQIATALNGALAGRLDCTTTVTLLANAITDSRIGLTTAALMHPTTADAAAELASGQMYWVVGPGRLTINHRDNAPTDRSFVVAFLG